MTDLLNGNFIIDGIPMGLSPARMLRLCSEEAPLEPDGDPVSVADEQPDYSPDNYPFKDSSIGAYSKALSVPLKRSLPLPFAGLFTAARVAQALIDAIWMSGHFRLGDLSLRAEWRWNDKAIGNAAAFYQSVESACNYIDALGLKIEKYSVTSGQPWVSFKATTVAEEDASDEDTSFFRELPYRTANPRISRRRKVPATVLPSAGDWLLYIPFDPCDYRLGGSALAQALGARPATAPDVSDADYFIDCYEVVRELVEDGVVRSGATVGEGGLLSCLKGMASAGTGADICLQDICKAYGEASQTRILFSEVPGVVIQIADTDYDYVDAELILQDVVYFPLGHPVARRASVKLTQAVEIPQILESLLNTIEGED